MKFSPNRFVGWQQRYIILKDRKLKYYKSDSPENMKIPLGIINFDHFKCTCKIMDDQKNVQFKIEIEGVKDRNFIFKAQTSVECADWQTEIHRHIQNS